jgi:hypothetical protein
MLTETATTATLTNTLNVGATPTVTRLGTGSVCIGGLPTTFANVQATPLTEFAGGATGPTNITASVVGQTGAPAGPTGCTTAGDVWVRLWANGSVADTLTVYLQFIK